MSRSRHRNGLLWIPRGGVDDTGSGTAGGSSGSGGGGIDTPVFGDRRNVCPMKGFSSSSPSGAGGGSGLGLGFAGDLRGAAAKLPLILRTDRPELGPASLWRVSSFSRPGSLAGIFSAVVSGRVVSTSAKLCSLPAMLGRRAVGRELEGFDGEAERLLSRIWGLCRARLALVGDAKDGRLRRDVEASGDWGVAAPPADAPAELRGETRLRLGADSSMAMRCCPGIELATRHRHPSRTRWKRTDASTASFAWWLRLQRC